MIVLLLILWCEVYTSSLILCSAFSREIERMIYLIVVRIVANICYLNQNITPGVVNR